MAQSTIDSLLMGAQHHLYFESIQTIGTTQVSANVVSLEAIRSGGGALGYRFVPRVTKHSAIAFGISLGGAYIESNKYILSGDYFKLGRGFFEENTSGNLMYKLYLEYVFRYSLSKKMLFEVQTGFNMTGLAFVIDTSGGYFIGSQGETFIHRRSDTKNFKSPIGMQLGIGLSKMLRNKNFIRLGIGYYYAPHNIFSAKYSFSSNDPLLPVVTAIYSQSASHGSITLGYVFSTNKKIFKK